MNYTNIPPVGTRCTITLETIFGERYERTGTIIAAPKQDGFILSCEGGWSCYGDESKGDVPCYRFGWQEEYVDRAGRRRKRKPVWKRVDMVEDLREAVLVAARKEGEQ